MQRFQSILQFKKVSCKNCYKCVRNCPVKAIRVHDHQARIMKVSVFTVRSVSLFARRMPRKSRI